MSLRERIAEVPIGGRTYRMASDDAYLDRVSAGFEADMVSLFQRLVLSNDFVLDVGANIGCTALLFGQMAAHVDAFEPSPSTFSFLERNVRESGLKNIEVHNVGLGACDSDSTLTFAADNRSGGFVSDKTKVSAGHVTERIAIRTMDGFLAEKQRPRIDFVKIDVEGFEQSVLEGGARTIARFQPVVVMELNHWCLALHRRNVPDYFDFLRMVFPILLAVDGKTMDDLHDEHARYHVMYHHINQKRYNNLIGAFSRERIAAL